MRIAELVQPHKFELIEGPVKDPGPGEVQARVASVGLCGSDLHYFAEGGVGDTACLYPMVLGHEPAGTITKTGAGVTGWSPGDRVALEPAIYCYHCEFCRTGRHNVCENIRFMSMPQDPGFLREYVNLPAANLLPLPAGLSMEEGTLFEPLAVILHSMQFVALRPGETAAVFGAGPIGLLTVAVLSLCGAGRIWSIEPVAARRELAQRMGAHAAVDPAAADPVRQILSETGQRGVDVAIDCAAKHESMNQCLHVTRNAGRVVVTGIPSESRVSMEFHVMRRKELALFNVRRSNHESEAALEMLKDHRDRFAPMLTHHLPLDQVERAFTILERYEDGVGKMLIKLA
jgi:L-iditol 2-dehydrogenase